MEVLLLGIYAFFVWLIFFKFKWLPWTPISQITVVVIPIVGLATLILLLNIYAPSSADVRVIKYVVQITPQVRGLITEVNVEGNRAVKKGEVLFRIDPTPYEIDARRIEAQLALAQTRLRQTRALAASGAGSKFDQERYESDVRELSAQLDKARWELSRTTVSAPANGTAINLQLRVGSFAAALGVQPLMSFVEDEYQVIALFHQNELHQVKPGDEAEISLETYPGTVIKAVVDSIVWAQGQGQLPLAGTLPETGTQPLPEGRFPVRLAIAERDRERFLAAGARGHAAIYTQHFAPIQIVRKVILRVDSYINWLVLKLH
ncbi:MAG: HlyD family secretion protein [Sulfurifustaceae bacterium]